MKKIALNKIKDALSKCRSIDFAPTGVPQRPGLTGQSDNWLFSVIKYIRLAETHDLRFRMDMFNMWNHPVFGFPSAVNIGTPATFGQITTTVVPARLIQFGLTYRH